MNLNFKFDLTCQKLAYISRKTMKLLYDLQWGEQVCAKICVMHMTCYPLNKKMFWHQDPDTPGESPETPDMKSGESDL